MKASSIVAPKTPAPKPPKGKGKTPAPSTHTHRCLAQGGHNWEHTDPCDGPKFRTRLCPAHQPPTHGEPGAITPEPTPPPEIVTPPATPEPIVGQRKAPKTRPLAIVPPEGEASPPAAPKIPGSPAKTVIHIGRRDVTRTPAKIGTDGTRIFARAWGNGKGYVPTLVVRTTAGARTVHPVGDPMASKADALAEAERLQAQHVAQQTLPQLRQHQD